MFQVRTTSPIDEDWEERDEIMERKARRKSDSSSATKDVREHVWLLKRFDHALNIKARLESVPGINVTIREDTSERVSRSRRK